MKNYKFYGSSTPSINPINEEYNSIKDQRDLYDLLCKCWSINTCAPRYRNEFSSSNLTVGQCSITSILVQDIFGGEIYGIPLKEGGCHCFNIVNGITFDLTSEQFKDQTLDYNNAIIQNRDEHLLDEGKKERYLLLKAHLLSLIKNK